MKKLSDSKPGTLAISGLPATMVGTNNDTLVRSIERHVRSMYSAYSGRISRRLRSFGVPSPAGSPETRATKILSGPNSWKKVTTPCRRPVSRLDTVTTVVMPITIPMMVSSERKRCAQRAPSAMRTFSVGSMRMRLFGPKRDDRVEASGARGRVPTRYDASEGRNYNGQRDVGSRYGQADIESQRQQESRASTEGNADESANCGQQDRLDQKLQHYVGTARPQRFPHADLACALGDAD